MKKLIFLGTFLTIFNFTASAQFVVADPTAFSQRAIQQISNITEQIQQKYELVRQFQKTNEIYNQGKEWYDGLKRVNNTVAEYKKIYETLELTAQIVDLYATNITRFRMDKNFSLSEIGYITDGYGNLLKESSRLVDDLNLGAKATTLSMTDKERLDMISSTFEKVRQHKALVQYYTNKNISVSYLRAKKRNNTDGVMRLYGLAH
ncbi:hypothetical protein AAE02nite_31810 [Adhaeribacter aerolatus]|uniref:Conjugal transfer protein TraI n=1 Tax=Adhaeribacter aerolatus TaxID=670289 RepID=A0A512B146_9BACT|nr:hypothetical protein [Adhaeribacter aerolatus]GEO05517.1 hypothetical protein AAE02nite_31810 [Adhaeribacter aerolatus]